MSLRDTLSEYQRKFQEHLFPFLNEAIGPLEAVHKRLVIVMDMARPEHFVRHWHGGVGRPTAERAALVRAFMAKAVLGLPTTRMLIERLEIDKTLRRLCGWERRSDVPSESTFSRAFAEFAASELPSKLHEALIEATHKERLAGHIARDATAIEAREKPYKAPAMGVPKPGTPLGLHLEPKAEAKPEAKVAVKRKRGRPKKGEVVPPKPPSRLQKQAAGMSLLAMLADLPSRCDVGTKRNAKGHQESWIGYKLHIDTADGDIPISCVLTSASVHDSQVAIPLATLTAARVDSCYDLMDAAYDAPEIRHHSRSLGHVPIIDINPRRDVALKKELADEARRQRLTGHRAPEAVRYNQRSSAERVNAYLKDNHGGDSVRVRGPEKVMCHLMFGILVIAIEQTLRLVT